MQLVIEIAYVSLAVIVIAIGRPYRPSTGDRPVVLPPIKTDCYSAHVVRARPDRMTFIIILGVDASTVGLN